MQMRESVTTLRRYFLLIGVGGICGSGIRLIMALQNGIPRMAVLPAILKIAEFGFILAFAYAGWFLRELLRSSPDRIIALLQINFLWGTAEFLLSAKHGIETSTIVIICSSILIQWYLVHNVYRLAAEAREGLPAPSASINAVAINP